MTAMAHKYRPWLCYTWTERVMKEERWRLGEKWDEDVWFPGDPLRGRALEMLPRYCAAPSPASALGRPLYARLSHFTQGFTIRPGVNKIKMNSFPIEPALPKG